MGKRGFLQMSFAWIFALVIGAFILFLAFFIAGKLMGTEQKVQDAIVSKEIGILLSPLEIGFESGKTTYLELPKRTRINAECTKEEPFGKQHIDVSEETLGSWSDTYTDLAFSNKYIFTKESVEGKKFYLFDLPFYFPYKVADVIVITSIEDQYCFIDPPQEVKDRMRNLRLENVHNASMPSQCPAGSKIVCFTGSCNINVRVNLDDYSGEIVKVGEGVFKVYGESLMYAAIFSDRQTYECQLKRLMQRTEKLGEIYNEKSIFINRQGCDSSPGLFPLITLASSFNNSVDLNFNLIDTMNDAKYINDRNPRCALW
ncbi:MAG: hypothetical protein KKB31_01295 [Nanoarchaeota archaeon]|nr:hypothetical protein [Nanoarchaeota archaeon]